MWSKIFKRRRPWLVVTESVIVTGVIAVVDREIHAQVPLALLYFLPAALAGTGLSRWQVPIFGAFCTVVAELSDAFPWSISQGGCAAMLCILLPTPQSGLYISEDDHEPSAGTEAPPCCGD